MAHHWATAASQEIPKLEVPSAVAWPSIFCFANFYCNSVVIAGGYIYIYMFCCSAFIWLLTLCPGYLSLRMMVSSTKKMVVIEEPSSGKNKIITTTMAIINQRGTCRNMFCTYHIYNMIYTYSNFVQASIYSTDLNWVMFYCHSVVTFEYQKVGCTDCQGSFEVRPWLRKHQVALLIGWWFGTFLIFPYIENSNPNWLIFFRGVETTSNFCSYLCQPSWFCPANSAQFPAQRSVAVVNGCKMM